MANSLRAKLSKLRHDRHITDAEYKEFIKKLDGHDRELKNNAIDEFAERITEACAYIPKSYVIALAEQMKGGNE